MSQQCKCKNSLVSVDNYREDLGEIGLTTQLLDLSQVGNPKQAWSQKDRIIKRTGRLKRGTGRVWKGFFEEKLFKVCMSTVANKRSETNDTHQICPSGCKIEQFNGNYA